MKAINQKHLILNKDIDCIGIDIIPILDLINYGYLYIERDSAKMD